MTFKFHDENVIPTGDWIYVFSSNLAGKHAKGKARIARVNFRAEFGVAEGRTSNAYAIPTHDKHLAALPLDSIKAAIEAFMRYAHENQNLNFFVTRIGCEDSPYGDELMGQLFANAPKNCSLPRCWKIYARAMFPSLIEVSASSKAGSLH
jgi:hypothetical protein